MIAEHTLTLYRLNWENFPTQLLDTHKGVFNYAVWLDPFAGPTDWLNTSLTLLFVKGQT